MINVSLRGLQDAAVRHALLRVPTAFEILPVQVPDLQAAGRMALRESPEFQRLRAAWQTARCGNATHPNATERRPIPDDVNGLRT